MVVVFRSRGAAVLPHARRLQAVLAERDQRRKGVKTRGNR